MCVMSSGEENFTVISTECLINRARDIGILASNFLFSRSLVCDPKHSSRFLRGGGGGSVGLIFFGKEGVYYYLFSVLLPK